ncbi:MAG: DUF1947 domain-containing protein [Desulfurococcales archaeon]|nr:DUF1947 domain-containing protein [Desulfurococcales archaeon]
MAGKPSRRHALSKKDVKRLAARVAEEVPGFPLTVKDKVELVDYGEFTVYMVNGEPGLVELRGRLLPHLRWLLKHGVGELPSVRVDPGATKAVGRGADLMVPGITKVEGDFEEGGIVVIVDDRYGAPIAVGVALMASEEVKARLEGERRGKAIKVLHRPGDKVWNAQQ